MKKLLSKITIVAFMLTLFVSLNTASAAAEDPTLKLVEEPSKVCMVNDRFMFAEQIEVKVGEKTYYGCCAGCVKKIQNNQTIRESTDPVSGETVDKASAVIGMKQTGEVLYFENKDNFDSYGEKK
ncbi:MAG: hypothetical protein KAR06_10085 [Deltaproteobacteria bacterium]|nr:hypothetical protein [Deltaproteobacteria bacterium]